MEAMTNVTLGRRLTPVQAERRTRLLGAARELAVEGGYEAVTVSAVCARAGVSRATVYHYFGSKDHLIAEVMWQWGLERTAELRAHPPAGATTLERVVATLRWVLEAVEREPRLFRAAVAAFVSPDLGVTQMQRQLSSLVGGYIEAALGSEEPIDFPPVGMVLSHVFFSRLVTMAAGRTTPAEVLHDLATTAGLVLEKR